jgi:hypothetical protein
VLYTRKPYIAVVACKARGYGMLALGVLGTVHAAARQKARKVGNAYAVYLAGKDIVYALTQVRYLSSQALRKALGDFPQEYARFGAGV